MRVPCVGQRASRSEVAEGTNPRNVRVCEADSAGSSAADERRLERRLLEDDIF